MAAIDTPGITLPVRHIGGWHGHTFHPRTTLAMASRLARTNLPLQRPLSTRIYVFRPFSNCRRNGVQLYIIYQGVSWGFVLDRFFYLLGVAKGQGTGKDSPGVLHLFVPCATSRSVLEWIKWAKWGWRGRQFYSEILLSKCSKSKFIEFIYVCNSWGYVNTRLRTPGVVRNYPLIRGSTVQSFSWH